VAATIRNGQTIRTTNHLLTRFPGIDGLKTGTTGRAGYCLVATSERKGWRLISVVLGATNAWKRFDESASLLYDAFLDWQRVHVVNKGDELGERLAVRQGELEWVRLLSGCDLEIIIPTRRRGEVELAVAIPPSTRAPVGKGWTLGHVQVFVGDSLAAACPAVAAHAVARVE
jgi:D-alanyl-D-alanine carboxypeptidase (penicillin-binding protein 5/6)